MSRNVIFFENTFSPLNKLINQPLLSDPSDSDSNEEFLFDHHPVAVNHKILTDLKDMQLTSPTLQSTPISSSISMSEEEFITSRVRGSTCVRNPSKVIREKIEGVVLLSRVPDFSSLREVISGVNANE